MPILVVTLILDGELRALAGARGLKGRPPTQRVVAAGNRGLVLTTIAAKLALRGGEAIVPLAPSAVGAVIDIVEKRALSLAETVVNIPHTVPTSVMEVLAV